MTLEILELMSERRRVKNHTTAYLKFDMEIRNVCQKAKELSFNNQCKEVDELEKKPPQPMHTKRKAVTRNYRTCSSAEYIEIFTKLIQDLMT